jgi:hypothetical protein
MATGVWNATARSGHPDEEVAFDSALYTIDPFDALAGA